MLDTARVGGRGIFPEETCERPCSAALDRGSIGRRRLRLGGSPGVSPQEGARSHEKEHDSDPPPEPNSDPLALAQCVPTCTRWCRRRSAIFCHRAKTRANNSWRCAGRSCAGGRERCRRRRCQVSRDMLHETAPAAQVAASKWSEEKTVGWRGGTPRASVREERTGAKTPCRPRHEPGVDLRCDLRSTRTVCPCVCAKNLRTNIVKS